MGKSHVLSNCYAQLVVKHSNCYAQLVVKHATIAARSSLQAFVKRVFNLKKMNNFPL